MAKGIPSKKQSSDKPKKVLKESIRERVKKGYKDSGGEPKKRQVRGTTTPSTDTKYTKKTQKGS